MTDYANIKDRLDLLSVITQETGLGMKNKHLSECPFCSGHECFSIDTQKQLFKCFQCEEPSGGDVFTFLERYHRLDQADALKKAAEMAGVTLKERQAREVKLSVRERIFIEAATYYHAHMQGNGGKAWLTEQRGHKEDIINRMKIGWTDGGLSEYLKSKGFTSDEVVKSGLAKVVQIEGKEVLRDFFLKGIAIFPHMEKGRVLHFTIKDPQKVHKYQLPEKDRLKDWKFYNQDALGKYGEIIVVEGENDLLSVLDSGADNVIGLIGSPAEYQVKALKTYCVHKHLYLWMDNDKGGTDFVRKLCVALKSANVRVITYQGAKDPDEYLRAFSGDRRKEVKRLQDEAINYITWEIGEVAKLETLEERLNALKERRVFAAVADMVEAEKDVYVEKLTALGFKKESIEEQLEVNHDLRNQLAIYFEQVPKKDADPNYVAHLIFKSLSEQGRFFRDRFADVHLMYQHHIYQIGSNRPFNALMKKMTNLLPTKEPGRSVWESLASEAYTSGMQIDLASWLHTDRVTDAIYVNLNSPGNVLLKISKDGIEEIPNGMNKEGVLLKSSKKIMPVNFHPDADISEGMMELKRHVLDNFTCEPEQRYLLICWMISAFLLDFAPYMGLMKLSGPSGCGKTTAARLISDLIYGNDHLGDPSAAAAYAVASQNPLLIIDNLESDDFTKSILKFLLLSATKGGKEKRTQGTDSETIQEQPKALVMITAIEPFVKAELINRTYDIEFSNKHKDDSFIEDETIRSLVKKRDLIMSAILKFISRDILPNLEKRREYITILKKEHKNHAKSRTDEYLAMLMLTLEKLLQYIPYYSADDFLAGTPEEFAEAAKEIRHAWIEEQNQKARETETTSNTIIKLLDGLVREYSSKMRELKLESHAGYEDPVFAYTHPEYLLEMVKTQAELCVIEDQSCHVSYIEFVATSGDLTSAFDRYCRNNGIKNPFEKASVLGARLRNDLHLLRKSGWELVVKDENSDLYFKVIRGNRFFKFRKTLVR